MNKRIRFICEIAIFTAIGVILDFIAGIFGDFLFPNGGSISIAMVAIFIMAYRWGLLGGLLTGLSIGIIQTFYGGYFIHWIQIFLDYWGAYLVVGASGAFSRLITNSNDKKKASGWIIVSVFTGVILRLVCAFTSGYVFFSDYAPDYLPLWAYSLGYNALYLIPSGLLCAVVLIIILYRFEGILKVQYEETKYNKDLLSLIASSFFNLIVLFLFTGKFFSKYDTGLSSHITGYKLIFGTEVLLNETSYLIPVDPCLLIIFITIIIGLAVTIYQIIKKDYNLYTICSINAVNLIVSLIFFLTKIKTLENIIPTSFKYNYVAYLFIVIVILSFLLSSFLLIMNILKRRKIKSEVTSE